jgi:hypothetical protein
MKKWQIILFLKFKRPKFNIRHMSKLFLLFICSLLFSGFVYAQNNVRPAGAQVTTANTTGIPVSSDEYWFNPQKTYEERRLIYLKYCASNSAKGRNSIFSQIACVEQGLKINEAILKEAIDFIYSNKDTNDFTVGGLLRLLYLYQNGKLVTDEQKKVISKCLLDFKYWWNEPGSNERCYWTENHQIIFQSDELLAGQLFKDKVFTNDGKNGRVHMQHATTLIYQWMDWRVRLGFSEWLSNAYFEEDLMALLNLNDFAEDPIIRSKAGLLVDVIMFEMALNNYHGIFGSTHGRSYTQFLKGARNESSMSTMKLMFGMGIFNSSNAMGAICLATSTYRCPEIIQKIATDYSSPLLSQERHSINIVDAPKYGISFTKESDCDLYWSIQDYTHPDIIDLSQMVAEKYKVWLGGDYNYYRQIYQKQIRESGKIVNSKLDPHAMTEVNIETYRTPEYMLSCAQDYRPGSPGYQQHIWQATLGIDAVVFTNHPGSENESSRPNYWAGNGILPDAAQYKNVAVCIYSIPAENPLPFLRSEQKIERNIKVDSVMPSDKPIPYSHAYFPKDSFDEVIEKGHWIFGKKNDGYIALYSQNPVKWKTDRGKEVDLVVSSPDNIWICEMGTKTQWKDFTGFINAITSREVVCNGLNVSYESPSLGEMKFGWSKPLMVKGETIPLNGYLRFNNPYCKNDFASGKIAINNKDGKLILDFANAKREAFK